MNDNKKALSGRNFKQGMYNSIVIVAVIAIVIILNLFVGRLGIKVDLTKENVYTLTDETKKCAEELNDDITIYYLAKENEEYEVLQNVIDQYDKLPHISVKWKDPELYPQFASQYTDSELKGNDVIVVNESNDASRFIPFDDMYLEDYSMNYSSYSYEYHYNLDAEGQITSAIKFVTLDDASRTKMYEVKSHGETELEHDTLQLINKANVTVEDFDARTSESIPEDCDILFINGPTTDISDQELKMYKEYLDNGGRAVLSLAYSNEDMPNYDNLIEYYGVKAQKPVVFEGKGYYTEGGPAYAVAEFSSIEDDISKDFAGKDIVIAPISRALTLEDASNLRSTLTVKSIVKSSDDAYGKVNPQEVLEKEEGDIDGPFDFVIQASDTYKDKTSKVVIFASPYMFKADLLNLYNNSNVDLLIKSLDWMGEKESITIPQRSLDSVYLEVDQKEATVWAVIVIIILPLGILAAGFAVWFFRRKR